MPMRERLTKQSPSKPSFKTEKRRVDAIRPEGDTSSCWSETTQSSAFSLEKPEAPFYSPELFIPKTLLQRVSRCLVSLQTLVQKWRKSGRNPSPNPSAENVRPPEIDARLSVSTAAMQQEPTILVLGDCYASHEFMALLQHSTLCISATPTPEGATHGGNCPRRPEWVHLLDSSDLDINEQIEDFHLHAYRPGDGERERKLSRIGRFADMTAVLFVADISSYDDTCIFDESCNGVTHLIIWWDSVVNTRCFDFETTMPFILCLSGVKDFKRKLKSKPLSAYFKDYRGKDEQEAVDYVRARFTNIERVSRRVYPLMIENEKENEVLAKQLVSVMKAIVAERN